MVSGIVFHPKEKLSLCQIHLTVLAVSLGISKYSLTKELNSLGLDYIGIGIYIRILYSDKLCLQSTFTLYTLYSSLYQKLVELKLTVLLRYEHRRLR